MTKQRRMVAVHHKDGNIFNNSPENLEVVNLRVNVRRSVLGFWETECDEESLEEPEEQKPTRKFRVVK